MITTNDPLFVLSHCGVVGKTVHNASFRFRAKNGDVKYLVVDSNVNFNEDGWYQLYRHLFQP